MPVKDVQDPPDPNLTTDEGEADADPTAAEGNEGEEEAAAATTAAVPEGDDTTGGDEYASDEEIEAYLASKGYVVQKPGAAPAVPAPTAAPTTATPTPAPQNAQSDFDRQFDALKASYGKKFADTFDDEERFAIQAEFQREVTKLQIGQIERQSARAEAVAALPSLEAEFEAKGLPKEAAREYAMLLADLPAEVRGRQDAQVGALQMALGRTLMKTVGKPGAKPNPAGVKIPKGEATGGTTPTADSGLTAEEMASLKRDFPNVKFTPAKIAELRKEGIL